MVIAVVFASLLALLGAAGLLLRRNLLFSLMSLNYLFLSVSFLFGTFASFNSQTASGQYYAFLFLIFGTLIVAALGGFLAFFFRRHHNLDTMAVDENDGEKI